jgi:hypothetical protein
MDKQSEGRSEATPKEASQETQGDSRLATRLRRHASKYLRHYPWDWADEAQEMLEEAASVIDASSNKQMAAYRLGVTQVSPQQNLTDEERAALSFAVDAYALNDDDHDCWRIAATLRSLLSRTGQNSRQTGDNAAKCTDQEGKTPERDHQMTDITDAGTQND